MKRVIIAAVMVVLLVALAATSNLIINRQLKNLYNDAKALSENTENYSEKELKIKTDSFIKKWKKTEKLLHYFESHDKYEEIGKHFGQLEINSQKNNADKAKINIIDLQNLLKDYIETRKINLQNVLFITKL